MLPVTGDAVPLFRRRDDEIGVSKSRQVGRHIASEFDHPLSQALANFLSPVLNTFAHECLERSDINALSLRSGAWK